MWVRSGGEVVAVDSELAWVTRLVARATGGSAPASGCSTSFDVGNQVLVPYTADYFFYKAAR